MREELETLLREIAFGSDPALTPDHRLRAVEQLRELGVDDEEASYPWERELREMDGDEVQALTDRLVAGVLLAAEEDELRVTWPETFRVLDAEVERRVAQRDAPRRTARNGRTA